MKCNNCNKEQLTILKQYTVNFPFANKPTQNGIITKDVFPLTIYKVLCNSCGNVFEHVEKKELFEFNEYKQYFI
ncbi:MAG: hypothetical protein RR626_06350 [Anaerovoracaceae bacterium]